MREFLSALRNGFGFLTTIPVGITMEGIEKLMKHIYLFPVIGAVLGLLLGAICLVSSVMFHPFVASLIVIISIYYLTGINHIDGLADFGDGIASHGTREEKIKAMRDTAVGTGGLIVCIIAILGIFASLFSILETKTNVLLLPHALIVAETSAKQSMVTVAAFGRKLHEGFGAMTVENTKISDFMIGMVFTGAVSYFFLGFFGVEAFIASQLAGLLVLHIANRHFGGVSGDVVGASNEFGRLGALLYIGGLAWMQL
ncbi:MAG: adenosylcobinamide-GDP ribazoletransferase [Euryarchaeota archaeon]|nr:adenosylcobinamide-GDP ribazoletransferase [Euryarchaeota archaeon]MBU4491681.1 adenosylcobinamide-GDP ribazoletransferase [Euryarchaeota archaeon]MCG2728080.1 adenosylcobinamide-GDP ribazoletransferase [Candidatus Methanoperedenaceae archaeon]